MVNDYDLLERLVMGSLVLLGVALVLSAVGFAALIVLPFAIGYIIAIILWWIYDKAHDIIYPPKKILPEPIREPVKPAIKETEPEEPEEDEPETAIDSDWVEPEPKYELSGGLHLSSSLTNRQRNELYTLGYNVIKISPFGTSGAAIYWVKTRHNESKEHAFFCYILEAELKKYTDDIRMNATSGPDLIAKWKGKEFCFDVETGKSLSRQPDWLESKFAYYQREYDRSFILVTKRTLKYKYSRYGDVITRGKIKETLRQLFRRR